MPDAVLLDTSFLINLLNVDAPFHQNVRSYYENFLIEKNVLKISTIAIAEYCIKGSVDELPLQNVQIVPFNFFHAKRTGEFAKILFEMRRKKQIVVENRTIIPNDSKLFAQADLDEDIIYFATTDSNCTKLHNSLKENLEIKFNILDINKPSNEFFGNLGI